MMFATGEIVARKFQIDRVLGQGGMGVVVAATHLHLGQRVALKFLLPEYNSNLAIAERFLREARASAQLRGEHVCRVSDVSTLENGAPYIVMELLHGRDLSSMLAEHGRLPVGILADYVVQACLGLAEAHAVGIVHRDLKPGNLFVATRPDGTPVVKILDFGIAKAPTTTSFKLTQTAAVMGSPGYMSPEQLRSTRDADVRSDIWALGVILYELACGRPPFVAESITELTLRVAMDPTPALRVSPAGFEQIVYRCLEKDPARRFQDVAQLAMALAPFGGPMTRERAFGVARVLSVAPGATGPGMPAPAIAVATTLGSSASSLERPRRERFRWGIVAGALAAIAIATVGFIQVRGGANRATATESSSVAAPPEPAPVTKPVAVPVEKSLPAAAPVAPSPPAAAPVEQPSPSVEPPRPSGAPIVPLDAAPGAPVDAGVPADAAPRLPPVRKITRPPPRAGSAEDVGDSRI
jgi:eukaryotic-like serine/threonine-protein kinase